MALSYGFRLACLVLFSAGLIQIALALLLRLLTSVLHRALAELSARWVERTCFAEPVVSHLAAFALVAAVVAPQYIRHEANLSKERVGIVCVMAALLVGARYAYALTRGISLIHSSRGQHRMGVASSVVGTPIQLAGNDYPLLAVAGFLSPKILVSRRLLDSGALSSDALEIALAHERAHLRQFDNLKLLILSSLDLPLCSTSVSRRWRRAAEIAADDDAAAGSRRNAILLAETLLTTARMVPHEPQTALALGLLPHEEDLEDRIHRLLGEAAAGGVCVKPFSRIGATLLLFCLASLLLLFAFAPFHNCAEYLLHLG